jgi:hypothetical protein
VASPAISRRSPVAPPTRHTEHVIATKAYSLLAASCTAVVFTACGATPPATGTPPTAGPHQSASGSAQLLLDEVQREFTAMRATRYQHHTMVDEDTGTFYYDCSGLVDYAAGRAIPAAAAALPKSTSTRPLAGDIEGYLHTGLTHPIAGWTALPHVADLRPGDVIAWQATEDSTTGDTGHVMVVLDASTPDPKTPGEWLVHVADSTINPHAADSRQRGTTGLGTGTIGLRATADGAPTAFYWQGGVSRTAKDTEIALGRPD